MNETRNLVIKFELLDSLGKLAVIGVLLVFFMTGFFIIVDLFRWDIGSIADWVSGMGTVLALLFVEMQIKEQQYEFNKDKNAEIKVVVTRADVPEKLKNTGGLQERENVVRTYAYNIGYSAGSFMFIGFATKEALTEIEKFNPHKLGNDPIIKVKDPETQLLLKPEREFERINSRGVSSYIDYDVSLLKDNFTKGSFIYSVYMDPLRKIYYSEKPIKI